MEHGYLDYTSLRRDSGTSNFSLMESLWIIFKHYRPLRMRFKNEVMKYMGSKNRIAKDILLIMLKERGGRAWVEPFVGGGNMIDKVDGIRIGGDFNQYAIQALVSIRDNVDDLPKSNQDFTESQYNRLKHSDEYPHKGYAGFAFSYGGKWLGGWRRYGAGKRDYIREAYVNAVRQSSRLQGVELINEGYDSLHIPNESLIYCDPPYESTTKYSNSFNHELFWDWCRDKALDGHIVFVSEYSAPADFECVWEKEITSSLTKDTGNKRAIEKLFTLSPKVPVV